MKDLVKLIKEGNIPEGDFWIRHSSKEYISVSSINIETYRKIKDWLTKNEAKFYTYTPKEDEKISLVLKGIKAEYDETDVSTYINNRKFSNIKIEKVSKIKYRKDEDKFFFLIQLNSNSKPAELTRLNRILNQPIRWEKLRKKRIFQCKRCQPIGHSSSNCTLEYKCVKCGKNHGPIKDGG